MLPLACHWRANAQARIARQKMGVECLVKSICFFSARKKEAYKLLYFIGKSCSY
jgi:hypothetical protein